MLTCAVQLVSWIPADVAAAALVDVRNSDEGVLHIAHPKPVPYMDIMESLAAILDVPLIPRREWVSRLEKASEEKGPKEQEENPALGLLHVFQVEWAEGETREALGVPMLGLERVLKESRTLADEGLRRLGEKDVKLWVQYWRARGFLGE